MTPIPPVSAPRRRTQAALAALSTLLVVGGGFAVASPAPAAAPAQSSAAVQKPNVRVTKVSATSTPTAAGTTVSTALKLKNVTPTRKSTRNTRLSLTNRTGTFRLGKAVVRPIAGDGTTTVRVAHTVKLKVPAGQYAVSACRGPVDAETCRTSAATVTVGPAALVASPAALTFGDLKLGSAPARRDVTFTNDGQTSTGTLTTAVSGAAFSITSSTCASSLVPGASCTVSLAFAPTTPGAATGALNVSGASAAAKTVALSGTGIGAPVLAISRTAFEFGDTLVGDTSAPVQLTVTNTGNIASGVPTVSLVPAPTDDFEITATTCTAALAPAATCSVSVTFAPTTAGDLTAGVNVSATPGGTVATALSGTGLAPAALTLAPGSVAFGDQLIDDTSDTQTLTLTNDGDVATGVPSVALAGDDADQFTIVDNGCTTAVAAGASCEVDVAFAPTASGAASASLTASATPGGTTSAALAGTGQTPAELSISETAYDFGYSDAPAEHTFTITNDGDATTGAPVVDLDGNAAFEITADTCTAALPGAGTCTVGVTYTGTGSTEQTADLTVAATPGGTVSAELTGSPVALSVTPTSSDFGDVVVGGTSDTQSFTLTNHRLTAAQIDGEGVTGPFPLDSSCFPVVIPAGGTCTFSAHFEPTTAGRATGSFDYFSQGAQAQVEVTGEGLTAAAFSVSPSTLDFGAYAPGDIGTQQVTLTNTGTQASSNVSFSITGPDAIEFYTDSTDCPTTLAGGASCTVTVGFAPITLGDKTATFTVAGAPGGTASMIGLGAPAGISLYAPTHDYGAVAVGGTSYYTFRVVNTTNNGEDMNSASSGPPFPLELNQDFTCVLVISTIQPHRWCTMTISFKPQSVGSFSTTLTAGGTNFNTQSQLLGTGVPARPARTARTADGFTAPKIRPMTTSIRLRNGKVEVLDN